MRTLAKETVNKVGETVTLKGWADVIRDHGKITFIDLRDRSGKVQCVGQNLSKITVESVVKIQGQVVNRPKKLVNPNLETGQIEVQIKELKIISAAKELPFPIDTDGYNIDEAIRLKYRYLDLRRPRMTENIKLRSQVTKFIRNYLFDLDFIEVETPMLTKTTPEGARDFLVPARLHPGNFYALPQSPQQYKQLLMVAGLERYFQIVKCFRDEAQRADRAYGEFTQLDIEMSFITQNEILQMIEDLYTKMVKTLFPNKTISQSPWPRIPHKEAIAKYRVDKPDLRKNKNNPDELAFAWIVDFPLFTKQSEEDFFYGSGNAKFAPSHHMFTAPHPEDISLLETNPIKVRGLQHDMVLNGYEIGGGSIRIHQPEIQNKVFDLIGFSKEQKKQFEHMLTAFTYGVPPHGGIAPGIDRFLMAVLGEPSIREVMAFPCNANGITSVMEAPSPADNEQLAELGIQINNISRQSTPYQKIISTITRNEVEYTHYAHQPVFTSEEAAAVRNTDLHQGAKALVLQADKDYILLVLPADLKADLDLVKNKIGAKKLAMVSKDTVKAKTGLEVGSVPPFGSSINLKTFVDTRLSDNQEISFNAGRHDRSIKMKYSDFIKLEKPTII